MELFSSNRRQQDAHNHCVPLLDIFDDDEDEDACFIVMPLLRIYNSPGFDSVDEILDFVRQTLQVSFFTDAFSVSVVQACLSQGLIYMHALNVAHR